MASIIPKDDTIIPGDLMFSENPDKHKDLYDTVEFGPGCDTPSKLSLLEDMFTVAGLSTGTHVLNPLVAAIVKRKT